MAIKKTASRKKSTARKKTASRRYSAASSKNVAGAMRKRKKGTQRSGSSGKKVTSRKQAIAIGLSEAPQWKQSPEKTEWQEEVSLRGIQAFLEREIRWHVPLLQ